MTSIDSKKLFDKVVMNALDFLKREKIIGVREHFPNRRNLPWRCWRRRLRRRL